MTRTGVIRSFTIAGGRKLLSVQSAALRTAINAAKQAKPKQPATAATTRPLARGE